VRRPKRLNLLLVIMAVTAVTIGSLVLGLLFRSLVDQERQRLAAVVDAHADAANQALATLAENADPTEIAGRLATAVGEDVLRGLGLDGRLRLIVRTDQGVLGVSLTPRTGSPPAPFVAQPLPPATVAQLTAAGGWEKKTLETEDEGAGAMLAAFAPLERPDAGVVAETSMAALRRPFVETAGILARVAIILIVAGAVVFLAVTEPLVRRLDRSEALLREMFENMRWGAAILESRGVAGDLVVVNLNRTAERLDHVDRDDASGRPVDDVLPWIRQTGLHETLRRVARTGTPEHVPGFSLADKPGSPWREAFVYRLSTGEIVTLYDDITQRKQAEESLRESEARWRSVIETQTVAIVVVDRKEQIRYLNKAAEALFGKSSQELVGAPFGSPITTKDIAEIEIIRPDRGVTYAEMRATALRWGGEDQHLLIIQDVSSHKRAEGDLRKLFQAIEQSPSSVVITDVQGRIEYVNPKFTQVSGYTYPEVVGKNPSILKSGHTSPDEYRRLWQTITSGKVWRGEFYNRKKSGELFWELAAIAPVRDAGGKIGHFVAVKEDITERKTTEEQLRASQRLEVIGQLTGGIAHDFNNLLGIVVGNLQLLEEKAGLDPEAHELIADAMWSAERGAQLTHRLLAFARRQHLKPRVLSLNVVVGEMTNLLRRTLGEKISVRELLAEGLWQTRIDRGQLESALLNLVVNARDAMPEGGTLTISTDNVVLPQEGEGPLTDVIPGEYVRLSVADTGTGMPPDVLARIFEPFFTTKRVGQGSGLGLSMVYGFVRQSEGHISVDSREGRGTTVHLFLPRARAAENLAEAPRTGAAQAVKGETILVVEDDERVRSTAINILNRRGYRVLAAGGAEEALDIVRQHPRIDLLFTDIVLSSGMDGVSLARRIRTARPEIRILLTSGDAADAECGLEADPPPEVLPKPYRLDDLTRKIREVLDRPTA
jgi:PAS domain S-box-containing protein